MKNTKKKLDLYQANKNDYLAPQKPVLLEIAPASYLAIAGQGAPDGPEFSDKIGALYGVAFTLKMTWKFAGKPDYAVGKLEGQWWAADGRENFACLPKDQWCWKLLIRTPDFIGPPELELAVAALLKKGKTPLVREVRLESIHEGRCVQMLHVGPYEKAGETIGRMQAHAAENGLKLHGRHHEIYLSDPRRVAPDRLKTILRVPVTARARGVTH
jgi:hypothetical protein